MSAVKPLEYTQKQLAAMTREDLERVAVDFGIAAHLFKNKPALIFKVLEVQGNAPDDTLTPEQEEFCQLFASDREFFGNGVQSYIEAFNVHTGQPGSYDAARSAASRLLMDVTILSRISEIMETVALNDSAVDKQLAFWMTQKAHPMAAVAAIREYNRLKKRVDDKGNALKAQLNLNQFNISITDARGKEISQKVTDYVLEITKAPQPKVIEGQVV